MPDLDWLDSRPSPQQRSEWSDCYAWLDSLGNAEDEWTSGVMRQLEANGGHPIPNLVAFRRIEAALERWRKIRVSR